MKTWDSFFDYVLPHVPDAGTALMTLHIRSAAIDFCNETRVLSHDLNITTVAGTATYDASLSGTGYAPVMPNSVFYGTRELKPDTSDRLNKSVVGWKEAVGSPLVFIYDEPFVIRLYPTPDEAIEIDVDMAVVPARDSTGVDDFIFERYAEVIAAGAVARIAAIPQKPYTNPQTAAQAAMEFANGKRAAKTDAYKSFTRVGTKVRLRKKF